MSSNNNSSLTDRRYNLRPLPSINHTSMKCKDKQMLPKKKSMSKSSSSSSVPKIPLNNITSTALKLQKQMRDVRGYINRVERENKNLLAENNELKEELEKLKNNIMDSNPHLTNPFNSYESNNDMNE